MAVDANVIIFARIKEEIGLGKTIRVAVDQGFKHALTTVLDAQITTLIASVVLYEIGSTTVKGFALTLMIGIIVSIFTAVVVTQLFVGLVANSKTFAKNKYFGVNEDGTPKRLIKKDFSFIKNRKIFYCCSAVVIVVGLVFAGFRGFNYGIDFTGGTMIQLDMGKKVDVEEVKDTVAEYDLKELSIILSGDKQEQRAEIRSDCGCRHADLHYFQIQVLEIRSFIHCGYSSRCTGGSGVLRNFQCNHQ